MNQNLTHITVVLDRSGSMSTGLDDTKGGFDAFVKTQQQTPGECTMSLVQFDTEYETVFSNRKICDVGPLALPRGMTALYDAVNRAIEDLGKHLKETPEEQRPGKVVIVIITDGHENSSREITQELLREKIKHQTEKYRWEFVYIGQDINTESHATAIGICASNAVRNAPNKINESYAVTADKLAAYRVGTSQTMGYSDEEKSSLAQ